METVLTKSVDDPVKVPHTLLLENRTKLSVTGVSRVFAANEKTISLEINGTNLIIEGTNMQVSKLDVKVGMIEVLGLINDMKYANGGAKSAKNLLNRIF